MGAAGLRQDQPRVPDCALHRRLRGGAQRGHGRRRRHPQGRRTRSPTAQNQWAAHPAPAGRNPPLQPHPTRRAAGLLGRRHFHAGRRDDREPVPGAQQRAAVAGARADPAAAERGGSAPAASNAPCTTPSAGWAHAACRLPPTRGNTSCAAPTATRGSR
jgi:hypothetical protein